MACILYEIVPSLYSSWAVCVPADQLKLNCVEMVTGDGSCRDLSSNVSGISRLNKHSISCLVSTV
jgi:hypothetical protein